MPDNLSEAILMRCIASCNETAAMYARQTSNAAREACEYWHNRADVLTEKLIAMRAANALQQAA